MTEVTRWDDSIYGDMEVCEFGGWVSYDDYEALRLKTAMATQSVKEWTNTCVLLTQRVAELEFVLQKIAQHDHQRLAMDILSLEDGQPSAMHLPPIPHPDKKRLVNTLLKSVASTDVQGWALNLLKSGAT
tara:strand:+ start:2256 stop:2645 length:390 start_codon:yes stop_codon:yes gene_type:complete